MSSGNYHLPYYKEVKDVILNNLFLTAIKYFLCIIFNFIINVLKFLSKIIGRLIQQNKINVYLEGSLILWFILSYITTVAAKISCQRKLLRLSFTKYLSFNICNFIYFHKGCFYVKLSSFQQFILSFIILFCTLIKILLEINICTDDFFLY